MKIYTKTGDGGETGLRGGKRVSKADARVEAYGEVDELNSFLGAALASLPAGARFSTLRRSLGRVQAELFHIGAVLASPPGHSDAAAFPAGFAAWLEAEIDAMTRTLKPLRRFILPGGSPAGAQFHLCRTVCRRAERAVVRLPRAERPDGIVVYLNRLSDYLFTAARWVNARLRREETEWAGLP